MMSKLREQFPGLESEWVFFDNAGGSQTAKPVVERITEYLYARNVQIGGSYQVSKDAAEGLAIGREAARTLVNASRPEEVIIGPSSTVLTNNLAASMRRSFAPGDEVVVAVSNHEANIGPWERLSEFGVIFKLWPVSGYQQRLEDLEPLVTNRTKLVCMPHVSNIFGWANDVAAAAAFVHARGAKLVVDGVAFAPHRLVDVQAWDVDYYVLSIYKVFGPHCAIMYGKHDQLLELDSLYHYFYGRDRVPLKLEPGNPSYEMAYSIDGVVEYLASIGGRTGDRRFRLVKAFAAITRQEDCLTDRLLAWLNARSDVRVIGSPINLDSRRIPTIAFKVDGRNSSDITRAMDEFKIAIRFGDFHSRRLVQAIGEDKDDGLVRVSMVHYNTIEEVDKLTDALSQILDH